MESLLAYERHLRSCTTEPFVLPQLRNHFVENLTLPPFIFHWQPEQTPEEFINLYLNSVEDMVGQYPPEKHLDMYDGIQARAMRGWLALAREHDLFLMLRSKLPVVVREQQLDYHGVDVLAIYKGKAFGVIAYTATMRGNSFHEEKMARHEQTYKHMVTMPMPLYLSASGELKPRTVNGIKLYPWIQVDNLVQKIMGGKEVATGA